MSARRLRFFAVPTLAAVLTFVLAWAPCALAQNQPDPKDQGQAQGQNPGLSAVSHDPAVLEKTGVAEKEASALLRKTRQLDGKTADAAASQQPAQGGQPRKSTKPIYGDIIIHK